MSYHIYTTPSIVLRERPQKEADRIYTILTRDLGLIRASASGVRKEVSKLRSALEPYSLSQVSLVRGREYWRITSAVLENNLYTTFKNSKGLKPLLKVFILLEKLIGGESPNQDLFDSVRRAVRHYDPEDNMFEPQLVAEILFHLGYLEKSDLAFEKKFLIKAINKGIEASGLA